MYVKEIMVTDVITVKAEDTVEKCASLLSTRSLSGLPVVDEQRRVIGIVTEKDVIKRAAKPRKPTYMEILGGIIYLESRQEYIEKIHKTMGLLTQDVMTKEVITVTPDTTIEDAATILVNENIKRLPVVDQKNKLIGIIARRDIMKHLFPSKES